MSIRRIARKDWRDELASFSRQHDGWLASLGVRQGSGEVAWEARELPLRGVSPSSHGSDGVTVALGTGPDRVAHEVAHVSSLEIDVADNGAERGLLMHGTEGETTVLEFRVALLPEQVDGV